MIDNIRTKVLNIGELLDAGWKVFRAKIKDLIIFTVMMYVATFIVTLVVIFLVIASGAGLLVSDSGSGFSAFFIVIIILSILVTVAVQIMEEAGVIVITARAIEGQPFTWWNAIQHVWNRLGKAVLMGLLVTLILSLLGLLLIIPAIIYGVYIAFWLHVIILKDNRALNALEYSNELVKDQWWWVFAVLLVFSLIEGAIGFVISLPSGVFQYLPQIFGNPSSESEQAALLFATLSGSAISMCVSLIGGLVAVAARVYFRVTTTVFFLNNDYLFAPKPEDQVTAYDLADTGNSGGGLPPAGG